MKVSDFYYELPPELIAQHPAKRRGDSRMLVVRRGPGGAGTHERAFPDQAFPQETFSQETFHDAHFRDLPRFLQPGDLLVLNNSRVLPARLFGRRVGVHSQAPSKSTREEHLSARIEALLVRQLDHRTWEALVKPGRKIRTGERLVFTATLEPEASAPPGGQGKNTKNRSDSLEAEVVGRGEYGLRTLRFAEGGSLLRKLQRIGHIPLPPYIHRCDEPEDRARYQTVYAKVAGSVAAPTAGLHFTRPMLARLRQSGVDIEEITLHVGLGTFQPIHGEDVEAHVMHSERYHVTAETAARINEAAQSGRRIVAVGTTTVRVLEHLAQQNRGRIAPGEGETALFIKPGFQFQMVGGLITNFHLPGTTLLMLVCAFAGRELTLAAYRHAVGERYRFYSYGDCMLIL